MVTVGGESSGDFDMSFPVQAFIGAADKAVDQLVVKTGKTMDAVEKKFVWMTTNQEREAEAKLRRTEFSYKMVLRMCYSEAMQTFSMVSNIAGWSKNQTYQMVANTITGVIGLISTANLAASTLALIPGVGPFLAAASVGNAAAGLVLSLSLSAQQASIQSYNDYMGDLLDGVRF